jgi:hypothetical protein
MHFEGWLDSLHDEDENTQSPVQGTCKYLVPQPPAAAQKLSLQNVQPVPHFQPALEVRCSSHAYPFEVYLHV